MFFSLFEIYLVYCFYQLLFLIMEINTHKHEHSEAHRRTFTIFLPSISQSCLFLHNILLVSNFSTMFTGSHLVHAEF